MFICSDSLQNTHTSLDAAQHRCSDQYPRPHAAQDADLYSLDVLPGDVLIAATDGLWDNTYDDELLQHLPTSADDVQRVRSSLVVWLRERCVGLRACSGV